VPQYFSISDQVESELRVQASRFVAWLAPTASREQAEELIAQRSEQFHDATHNCFAYRIGVDDRINARSSDAREPAGSAGRPILHALEARHLSNIVAVVSRYFGGTKLGIGGLIRAYGGVTFAAIDAAKLVPICAVEQFHLRYTYPDSAAVEKSLREFEARIIESRYGSDISKIVEVRQDLAEDFRKAVIERSAGRASIQLVEAE